MNTYKITNITNTVGKREPKYNKIVNIDYVSNMQKKTTKINPGESIFLAISQLPLAVQGLRIGGFIEVMEVSETQLASLIKPIVSTLTTTVIEAPPTEIKPEIQVKKRVKSEDNSTTD